MRRVSAGLLILFVLAASHACAGSRREHTPRFDRGLELGAGGQITEAKCEFLSSLEKRELPESQCIIDISVDLADAVLDSTCSVACAQDAFRALQLMADGQYCEAIYLLELSQPTPPNAAVTMMVGHSYLKWAFETNDLILAFEDADSLDCRGESRETIWRADYLAAAASHLQRASREAPDSPLPHYLMALVYADQGKYEKADEECLKARSAGRPCTWDDSGQ